MPFNPLSKTELFGSSSSVVWRTQCAPTGALDPNAAVFHLPAIALEADRPGCGNFQLASSTSPLQVARATPFCHRNDQLVPVLRLVRFRLVNGPGEAVVAALQLRPRT